MNFISMNTNLRSYIWKLYFIHKYGRLFQFLLNKFLRSRNSNTFYFKHGGYFNTFEYGTPLRHVWRMFGPNFEYLPLADIAENITYIDVGAHYGEFCCFIAKINPRAIVYAYEPSASNYAKLKVNVQTARLENLHIFNLAVDANTGDKVWVIDTNDSSTKYTSSELHDKKENSVTTISLKDIVEVNNIKEVCFLKLDCEGKEYDIVLGCNEDILKIIKSIGIEFHNSQNKKHTQFIRKLGRIGFYSIQEIFRENNTGNVNFIRDDN